jgi:ribonuclease P protein component
MKPTAIGENHLYSKVYQRGRRFVGRYTAVYVLADRRANALMRANPMKVRINRIGITCTKKIGKAVIRSRVKRIIREAWRQTDLELCVKKGNLIVIAARDGIQNVKTQDVKAEIGRAVKKLGLA